MKNLNFLILSFCLLMTLPTSAQTEMRETEYNTLSFVYADNSEFGEYVVMNDEVEEALKKLISNQSDNKKHCFYFIATNEEKRIKQEIDSKELLGSNGFLAKYLSRDSRDADYFADKDVIREQFVNYPIRVKQQINIYFILSSAAVRRLFTDVDLLPTPLLISQELLQYINLGSNVTLNLKIYTNKEVLDNYSEDKIMNQFMFSNNFISENKFDLTISTF